jgi:hypothetical protein
MTQTEALRLALGVFETMNHEHSIFSGNFAKEIIAIKAALANEALERKAENARELGLDYEPYGFEASIYSNARMKVDVVTGNVSIGTVKKPCGLECDCTDVCKQEAKDEPVKLRRGDILRCNESDELCTVWATSTSGKTLVKWKDNDFGNYTAEQIGELFWIEPKEEDEPDYKALWQQMCERCDELDKKLAHLEAKDEPFCWYDIEHGEIQDVEWNRQKPTYEGNWKPLYTTPPQRTWVGLTDEEVTICHSLAVLSKKHDGTDSSFTTLLHQQIEAKLKEKNT